MPMPSALPTYLKDVDRVHEIFEAPTPQNLDQWCQSPVLDIPVSSINRQHSREIVLPANIHEINIDDVDLMVKS